MTEGSGMLSARDQHDILVIEDNDDDFEATTRALSGSGLSEAAIARCRDGEEALRYLGLAGPGTAPAATRFPALILLDLNMPGLDGRKFLRQLKKDSALRVIPIVIISTSNDSVDVQNCYDAGANTYVCKPVRWAEFRTAVAQMCDYWFGLAVLPHLERARPSGSTARKS